MTPQTPPHLIAAAYSQLQYGTDDAHFQHIFKILGHTSGFDINALDDTHNSLLHHACGEFFLNTCLIAFLLNHGADPHCVNSNGVTPLETLIVNGGLVEDALQHFLRNGADLRTVPPDKIPTHFRAFCARMCEHRDQREHCDAATHTLGSVLIEHIRANNLDGVRCVLAATPKLSSYGDGHYLSVVHHACGDTVGTDIFQEILSHTPPLNVVDLDGNTPLHVLLSQPQSEHKIKSLLRNSTVDLFEINNLQGHSVLNHCINLVVGGVRDATYLDRIAPYYTAEHLSRALRTVLTARPFVSTPTSQWSGACLDMVHTLIAYGADVNARNRGGQTILHDVARQTFTNHAVIELLFDLGADWTVADFSGHTPIALASETNRCCLERLALQREIGGEHDGPKRGKKRL